MRKLIIYAVCVAFLAPQTTIVSAQHAFGMRHESIVDSFTTYGEFAYRKRIAYQRMTNDKKAPVFSKAFILGDVDIQPDNPRRFYNFSGDLSGRYFEVMVSAPESLHRFDIKRLMGEALLHQKADGRFGDEHLAFTEQDIGGEHMALLWGNGRFLVGLMEYYRKFSDPQVLAAARRLGDFFIRTYEACSKPEVAKKLEGFGAKGIICFTQYIEGLVMLSQATGDQKYTAVAAKTYEVMGGRGEQHTHGYLTTLRGVVMLYQYTRDEVHLSYAKQAYDDLVASDDMTLYGSVKEYFGNIFDRDEGCSTADFVRLSFDLYAQTGNLSYLEKGEYALYNSLYFNQYYSGDFGHHNLHVRGSGPGNEMAAWWCCTMHGLRALQEVESKWMIRKAAGSYRLDLYLDTDVKHGELQLQVRRFEGQGAQFRYRYLINAIGDDRTIAFRFPEWADEISITKNGKMISPELLEGYLHVHAVQENDKLMVTIKPKVRIRTGDQQYISISDVGMSAIQGCLMVGPFLMGVDERNDVTFTGEPNDNVVYVGNLECGEQDGALVVNTHYQHGGFPSYLSTTLRPVSSLTFTGHAYQMAKLHFTHAEGDAVTEEREKSILNPAGEQ